MVASFVMLPLGLLLSARFLERGGLRGYLSTLLAIAALFVTHPMALMFLGPVIAVLAILRVTSERSAASLVRNALLVAPWGVAGFGLFLSSTLGSGRVYQIGETFRRTFHIVDLAGSQIMGSYHLILHPFVLIAIPATFVLWTLNRRMLGSQVLFASVAASLALMYVPPVATVLAEVVNEEVVWRAHWIIPVPLAIAYGLHTLASRIPPTGLRLANFRLSQGVALVLLLTAVCSGTFLVQEQYAAADDGAFYNRMSQTSLLPWTDGSIALGGVERAFSSEWRLHSTEDALLKFLKENAPPGSTILVPPSISDRFFPAVLRDVKSVDFSGGPRSSLREAFAYAYYAGTLDRVAPGRDVDSLLDAFSVDWVVIPPRSELDDDARSFAYFDADDFVVAMGEPELIPVRVPSGDEFNAWSFDGRSEERISGVEFTVPADLDPSRPMLEFVLETAPAETVAENAAARLVITYFLTSGGQPRSVVTTIRLEEGTPGGERFITRRPVGAAVEAGESYRFIVARLTDELKNELAGDVLFSKLLVKYWSTTDFSIGDAGFLIYER